MTFPIFCLLLVIFCLVVALFSAVNSIEDCPKERFSNAILSGFFVGVPGYFCAWIVGIMIYCAF